MEHSATERPIADEIRAGLIDPLIEATRATLCEMASADVIGQAVDRTAAPAADGIAVLLTLTAAIEGTLVFCFPEATAAAFARRMLGDAVRELDPNLVQDCMGEIANVIAGQAKAMLAETAYRFTYSIPKVVGAGVKMESADCLVIRFTSDLGPFALQLVWPP